MDGRSAASSGKPARWFSIKNLVGAPSVISIHDEIGDFGVTAQDFIRDVSAISGDLELHLSTPGGDAFDGLAIYAALKQRPGNVAVVVDSLAASIGSVIAMAASPGQLTIMPNASMMIHDASGYCVGTQRDMADTARLLESMSNNIADVYASRTGKPADHWRGAMLAETWYFGQDAVDAGLADRVVGVAGRATNLAWGPGETAAFRAAFGSATNRPTSVHKLLK